MYEHDVGEGRGGGIPKKASAGFHGILNINSSLKVAIKGEDSLSVCIYEKSMHEKS